MTEHFKASVFSTTNPSKILDALWDLAKRADHNYINDVIFLPTSRACRAIEKMFVEKIGHAIIPPKLIPLGNGLDDLDDSNVMDSSDRLLILLALIMAEQRATGNPESISLTLPLANSLIQMLDYITTEQIDVPNWDELVDDKFATHWVAKAKFLNLVTKSLPKIMSEYGVISSKQKQIIDAKSAIKKIDNNEITGKIIVCGSTASIPSTAELMQSVLRHKNGIIILPGAVHEMTEQTMQSVIENGSEHHPYFGIFRWLKKCNLKPSDIQKLDYGISNIGFLNQCFEPTEKLPSDLKLNGVKLIECENESIESQTLALMIRDNIEQKKSVLVVTPDIGTSYRISKHLSNMGTMADLSSGQPASMTAFGNLFIMILNAYLEPHNPVNILGILKHKFVYCGITSEQNKKFTEQLERHYFRKPITYETLNELKSEIISRDGTNDEFASWTTTWINALIRPENNFFDYTKHSIATLCKNNDNQYNAELYTDESKSAWLALNDLNQSIINGPLEINLADYKTLCMNTLQSTAIRNKNATSSNISVLGPIEARLLTADTVILSGLNEGMFPKNGFDHPWVNRKIIDEIGLPHPERKVGLMALDFMTLSCAKNVYWVRSKKMGSEITTESRFLSRVDVISKRMGDKIEHCELYTKMAESLDNVEISPITPLEPRPPVNSRINNPYVTDLDLLIHNPYAYYAKCILKLRPLDEVNREIDSRDFGNLIHSVLEKINPNISENDLIKKLDFESDKILPKKSVLRRFWHNRFVEIAPTVIKMLQLSINARTEISGSLNFGKHTIRARADRIWNDNDTGHVLDIKTGTPPSKKSLNAGNSPQLPLSASMLINEPGFINQSKCKTAIIHFLQLQFRNTKLVTYDETSTSEMISATHDKIEKLFEYYSNPNTPFVYRETSEPKYQIYDQLARTTE